MSVLFHKISNSVVHLATRCYYLGCCYFDRLNWENYYSIIIIVEEDYCLQHQPQSCCCC